MLSTYELPKQMVKIAFTMAFLFAVFSASYPASADEYLLEVSGDHGNTSQLVNIELNKRVVLGGYQENQDPEGLSRGYLINLHLSEETIQLYFELSDYYGKNLPSISRGITAVEAPEIGGAVLLDNFESDFSVHLTRME